MWFLYRFEGNEPSGNLDPSGLVAIAAPLIPAAIVVGGVVVLAGSALGYQTAPVAPFTWPNSRDDLGRRVDSLGRLMTDWIPEATPEPDVAFQMPSLKPPRSAIPNQLNGITNNPFDKLLQPFNFLNFSQYALLIN